jgi:CRISPR/Cas system CSM-associated protein Csm3 (group 7 of RAMP superfamily)
MARPIASRLLISGKLIASGPLQVGGVGGNGDVDLALAKNGQGKLSVPGTSLAGPVRAWMLDQVDGNASDPRKEWQKLIDNIWGFQKAGEDGREPEGRASFVIVEDGVVTLPAGVLVERRDGVGIDRVRGAAAEHVKYDREVLPSGSEITFEITVELVKKDDPARDLILAALQALQRGEIRFGASKTRGLGKVILNDLIIREQHLDNFAGILTALRGDEEPLDPSGLEVRPLSGLPQSHPKAPRLEIKIVWAPRGPLMVKAERDGVAVDMLPLVSAIGTDLTLVLPGSSIKGALRSHAERIVRTVRSVSPPAPGDSKKDFLKQIEITEREGNEEDERSLIGALFGAAGKAAKRTRDYGRSKDKVAEEGPPLLGLSALAVEDCYATPRFSPRHWEAIESAPDTVDIPNKKESSSPLRLALQNAGLPEMQQAFHVAIDRWTGGAADGFLYTVLEPHGIPWEPMQLTLDLARLRKEDRNPAVMCLLLTLRDLVNGRIPLGFAANRGMGALEVTEIEITGANLDSALSDLKDVKIVEGKLGGWSERLKSTLEKGWNSWLVENAKGDAR